MKVYLFGVGAMLLISSCSSSKKFLSTAHSVKDDGNIEVVFVQANDVYEIAPLADGSGGLSKLAALKKTEAIKNPNTFLVMAGDFLSPSVYNTLQYQGKLIRGRQMIDVMNTAGFDLAIFGNHEFDVAENELQERIDESNFQWISSNVFHQLKDSVIPFAKYRHGVKTALPEQEIITVKDKDGTTARIGVIGLTITSNNSAYVHYRDPLETAKKAYDRIKDSCDAIVAITHQKIREDIRLAGQLPGLSLILGGHEHDGRYNKTGNVYIVKSHANARSAYVMKLRIDVKKHSVEVFPELKMLDEKAPADSATDMAVKKWMAIADQNYSATGFDPEKIIIVSGDSLEGREAQVRRGTTNFTRLIVSAMADACPQADLVMMNAGSIRLDDVLDPPVSEYDMLRSLPFGGSIREVEMKGSLLAQTLEAGEKSRGGGAFLHYYPVGMAIDPGRIYRVGLTDFLLSGGENNIRFLNKDNPGIVKIYDEAVSSADARSDIRLAIVRYLLKKKIHS
jgi:2',3'-cyclic-nucleotide 2'-phosphodiesterase (5'-nucleotidase family)